MKRRLAVAVLALVWLVPVGTAAARLTPPPEQPSYRPHDETSGNPPRDPCDGWGFDDNGTCTVWAF